MTGAVEPGKTPPRGTETLEDVEMEAATVMSNEKAKQGDEDVPKETDVGRESNPVNHSTSEANTMIETDKKPADIADSEPAKEARSEKVPVSEENRSAAEPAGDGEPETVPMSISSSVAAVLHQRSAEHGAGYLDQLLELSAPALDPEREQAEPAPIDEWIPKIGLDAHNKSVEIDVGSQVVVVNLADFYKPRHTVRLLSGGLPPGDATPATAASGLHLLAATAAAANSGLFSEPPAKLSFHCCVCPAVWPSQMALRLHCATAHRTQPSVCVRCGLSFLTQRALDRHHCEELQRQQRERKRKEEEERQRVPPVVIRPSALQSQRVKRLEDTSSSESDSGSDSEPAPKQRPPPPPPPPVQRPPPPPAKPSGKKEAYVCRVCHSKFRDPKAVLSHLKEFHPEHARKAWNKFQENLRSRAPGTEGASAAGGGGRPGPDGDKKVPPMRLKLARVSGGRGRGRGPGRPPGSGRGRARLSAPETSPRAAAAGRRPSPPYPTSPPPAGPPSPGFVTCGVCGGTKYYTYTAQCRLTGCYACESCRRFVRLVRPPQPVQCLQGPGHCHIPAVAPRNSADSRCRACWLKRCLLALNLPRERHDKLRQCLPSSLRQAVPPAAEKVYRQSGHCELDTVHG